MKENSLQRGSRGDRGGQRGGINERARTIISHSIRSSEPDVAATCAERLTQCAIWTSTSSLNSPQQPGRGRADQSRLLHCASSSTSSARTLSLVEPDQARRAIAVHGKHRLSYDENSLARMCAPRPLEVSLQFSQIVVRKDAQRRAAQLWRVDQRRVAEFVEQTTSFFRNQRWNVPSAAAYPLLKQSAASVPFHSASARSQRT